MKTTAQQSEGARLERAAIRSRLRRKLNEAKELLNENQQIVCQELLDWVLARQKRYDKRVGGLGKK